MNVAIVGAGYVGLTVAVGLAHLQHNVTCVERNPDRRRLLDDGGVPFHEEDVENLLQDALAEDRIRFAEKYEGGAEIVMLAVGTPSRPDGSADLTAVEQAVTDVEPHLEDGAILVVKSTVPVGTCRWIQEQLVAPWRGVRVVSHPEFLREGSAMQDFLGGSRVVAGADDREAAKAVLGLYKMLDCHLFAVGLESAEMSKMAANALLASRVCMWNEVADVCGQLGADVEDVASTLRVEPNIGPYGLFAGPGIGGSCFPKDMRSYARLCDDAGVYPAYADAFRRANHAHIDRMVLAVRKAMGGQVEGCTLTVLGLAYKAGTDDVRESPAVEIARRLRDGGAHLMCHDPQAKANAQRELQGVTWCDTPYAAASPTDAVLILTEWPEYAELDWRRMADAAMTMEGARSCIFDFRNVVPEAVRTKLPYGGWTRVEGFDYRNMSNLFLSAPQPV